MTPEERKEYMKVYNKNYRLKNRDKLIKTSEDWNRKNAEYRKKYMGEYLEAHKEEKRAYDKSHYQDKRDEIKKKKLAYYHKNSEKICEQKKLSYPSIRGKRRKYIREKRQNNPYVRMVDNLRRRIHSFFASAGKHKSANTTTLLGADYQTVMEHLESQFKEGMTWENHSMKGWHIDHIVPLCTAKNEKDLLQLFHYKNLQPLWAIDNLKKARKTLVSTAR